VKKGGVVFVNASIIPIGSGRTDVDELRVPIMELAGELGNVKAANIVALAAFVARSRIVSFEALTAAVKQKFAEKAKLIPLNLKALEAGRKAAGA
jgi:2-oxoglutarate ferredoxin oxidoreductase subunit gamma